MRRFSRDAARVKEMNEDPLIAHEVQRNAQPVAGCDRQDRNGRNECMRRDLRTRIGQHLDKRGRGQGQAAGLKRRAQLRDFIAVMRVRIPAFSPSLEGWGFIPAWVQAGDRATGIRGRWGQRGDSAPLAVCVRCSA